MSSAVRARRALLGRMLAGLLLAGLTLLPWMPSAVRALDGPTPYPARLEDWPGRGWARADPWMTQNRQSFWKQRDQHQGAVVFAGDSLVAGWPQLEADFAGLRVAQRGIGGDTSRGLLFRWQEDVLALHPKAVVLLIGTNDLSAAQRPADTVFNIERMLDTITVPVLLCTVPPRDDPNAVIDPARLLELNAALQALAATRRGVTLIDLHALLADGHGAPRPAYFRPDRLHLTPDAYQRWRGAVAQWLAASGVH